MSQATKAKFLESGLFHQDLKARVEFSVQHDAHHGSSSSRRGVNRLLGWTLDCVGGSSSVWNWKHNVVGMAEDIDIQPLCRVVNESVGAALKSHVRWLKRMGQPVIEGAV